MIVRGRVRFRRIWMLVRHFLVMCNARGVFSRFKLCPREYHNQVCHYQHQCAQNLQHLG